MENTIEPERILQLCGKTLICGEKLSGKSKLLVSAAKIIIRANPEWVFFEDDLTTIFDVLRAGDKNYLLVMDDAEKMFAGSSHAAAFVREALTLSDDEKSRLHLVMTTTTITRFVQQMGEDFLYDIDNHLVLKNFNQKFYEMFIVETQKILPGQIVPIISGTKQPAVALEWRQMETQSRFSGTESKPLVSIA